MRRTESEKWERTPTARKYYFSSYIVHISVKEARRAVLLAIISLSGYDWVFQVLDTRWWCMFFSQVPTKNASRYKFFILQSSKELKWSNSWKIVLYVSQACSIVRMYMMMRYFLSKIFSEVRVCVVWYIVAVLMYDVSFCVRRTDYNSNTYTYLCIHFFSSTFLFLLLLLLVFLKKSFVFFML